MESCLELVEWTKEGERFVSHKVKPDTKCPECGKGWKEGATYGHSICCGCPTCGWSNCVDIIAFQGGLV